MVRAVTICPHIDKYVKETPQRTQGKYTKIQTFTTVQQCTSDPPFHAKPQFFIIQTKSLKSYLEKFQNEKPMAVFMAADGSKQTQFFLEIWFQI